MIRTLVAAAFGIALWATPMIAAEPPQPGAAAPDFTLNNAQGTPVSLKSSIGKIVVLEWVNYDCPFVVKHYGSGHMQELQKTWTAKGVVWLSICSSAPGKQGNFAGADLLAKIAENKAVPTAYLDDQTGSVGHAYGATTTPTMIVIDAKGVIQYRGAIDSIRSTEAADIAKATNYVDEALKALTIGKPVATAQTKSYGCGVKYAQ